MSRRRIFMENFMGHCFLLARYIQIDVNIQNGLKSMRVLRARVYLLTCGIL